MYFQKKLNFHSIISYRLAITTKHTLTFICSSQWHIFKLSLSCKLFQKLKFVKNITNFREISRCWLLRMRSYIISWYKTWSTERVVSYRWMTGVRVCVWSNMASGGEQDQNLSRFELLEQSIEQFIETTRQIGIIVSDVQPGSQGVLNQKM